MLRKSTLTNVGATVLLVSLAVACGSSDSASSTDGGRSLLRNLRATLLLHLAEVSETTKRFFSLTDAEAHWLPQCRLPREAGYAEGLLRFGASHLPLAVVASTPEFELLGRALRPPADGDGAPDATARL